MKQELLEMYAIGRPSTIAIIAIISILIIHFNILSLVTETLPYKIPI